MRYYMDGYLEESKTGERYLREKEHNEWHDTFEEALIGAMRELAASPSCQNADRLLALQRVYFSDDLHRYNVLPKHAANYE